LKGSPRPSAAVTRATSGSRSAGDRAAVGPPHERLQDLRRAGGAVRPREAAAAESARTLAGLGPARGRTVPARRCASRARRWPARAPSAASRRTRAASRSPRRQLRRSLNSRGGGTGRFDGLGPP
jgi:hypothetical protein